MNMYCTVQVIHMFKYFFLFKMLEAIEVRK